MSEQPPAEPQPAEPQPTEPQLVAYSVQAGVATLVLDSPANRNALSAALIRQLSAGLRRAGEDEQVRAVLLTHTGPAFCAGADLREVLAAGGLGPSSAALLALLRQVVALPKPVLARITGPVRAGGTGLVAACDLAFATEDVTFALPEARLALTPAIISAVILPRVGPRQAAALFLRGSPVHAAEAARAGLITAAVPAEQLDGTVSAALTDLLAAHPQGAAETKALLNRDLLERLDRDGAVLTELSARLFASPAAQERIAAAMRR